MIYRISFFFLIALIAGCNTKNINQMVIEENYSFWDQHTKDSIKCLQLGKIYVDERNIISIEPLKHELVDETKAEVKMKGTLKVIGQKMFFVCENDTFQSNLNFDFEKKILLNQELLAQGIIQIHPVKEFNIDGLLILDIQKKSP